MIDLHMHSNYSDGTDSVEKLIDNVIDSKITYFSLTDHDTAKGCRKILNSNELMQKIGYNGLNFVPGIEFSCTYNGRKVHILAYDINPFSDEIYYFEEKLKNLMKEKDIYRFKSIEDDGYVLSDESREFLNSRINIRTPDAANCLVNDGCFDNFEDTIAYLKNIKYPRQYLLDAVEVIDKVSKTGAKLVWAHSIYGMKQSHLSFEAIEEFIKEFKKHGLSGLECYYSLYEKQEIDKLRDLAKKYDLFITCGSDYHGKNKSVKLLQCSADGSFVNEDEIDIVKSFKNVIN